jgi:hypothetical protein
MRTIPLHAGSYSLDMKIGSRRAYPVFSCIWLVCHVLVHFPPRREAGLEATMSSVLTAAVILMLVVLAEAVHHRFQRERRRKRISGCMLGCLK